MPLSNPYPPPEPGAKNHKVCADVSHQDYYFIKNRFQFLTGLTDKVLSTLYKKLIDELRAIDTQLKSEGYKDGLEPAWYIGNPAYDVLESMLNSTSFGERERYLRMLRPRNDGPAASGVREEGGGASVVSADEEGESRERGDKARRKKKTKSKG